MVCGAQLYSIREVDTVGLNGLFRWVFATTLCFMGCSSSNQSHCTTCLWCIANHLMDETGFSKRAITYSLIFTDSPFSKPSKQTTLALLVQTASFVQNGIQQCEKCQISPRSTLLTSSIDSSRWNFLYMMSCIDSFVVLRFLNGFEYLWVQ